VLKKKKKNPVEILKDFFYFSFRHTKDVSSENVCDLWSQYNTESNLPEALVIHLTFSPRKYITICLGSDERTDNFKRADKRVYMCIRVCAHRVGSFNVFHGDFNCPEKELIRYTACKRCDGSSGLSTIFRLRSLSDKTNAYVSTCVCRTSRDELE